MAASATHSLALAVCACCERGAGVRFQRLAAMPMVAISQSSSGRCQRSARDRLSREPHLCSALLPRALAVVAFFGEEIIIDNTQCKSLILGMMVEQYLLVRPTADFHESLSTTSASTARM